MKHFFTILGCLLLALAGGAEEPEFYVGVCTHFAQNKGTPSQNLEMAARAGIEPTANCLEGSCSIL